MTGIDYKKEVQEGVKNKLKNRLYEVLCKFEEKKDWENNLDKIYIELLSYDEKDRTINYYILLSKLGSLKYLKLQYFRTTIFDSITLVEKLEGKPWTTTKSTKKE